MKSYGESGSAPGLGLRVAAQKRTCATADGLDLDRKSGRRKADGPILRFRRLLLGSVGASGTASRRGSALEDRVDGPFRVTAPVSRMRAPAVAAREAGICVRTPR